MEPPGAPVRGSALTEESLVYALYTEGATRLYRWDYRQEEPEETGCERLTIRDLEARNPGYGGGCGEKNGHPGVLRSVRSRF